MSIRIQSHRTAKVVGIGDDLFSYLEKIPLAEKSILAISSKVISVCEGRVIKKTAGSDIVVKREAEKYIERSKVPGGHVLLTLKRNILTASAGVDEFDGYFVLWPRDPARSAEKICRRLKKERKLQKFGVIITDSHTVPLRRGTLGFGLSYFGFAPLRSYRGRMSLFGRKMKMTQANVVDALAAAAVLAMGEGGERTPFAVISGKLDVQFLAGKYLSQNRYGRFEVPTAEDLYQPLLSGAKWRRGESRE
ncbi:MAG: coenzyme F420-0:L-glutamate ligase [Patescibacteria group bacterium]|nr:coenzyme F420-0:L-glutamate ligase [Patescibacteria group bacterium]